jgi:hypothetical protein
LASTSFRARPLALLLSCALAAATAPARAADAAAAGGAGQADFQQGVSEYHAGRFEAALADFQRARARGYRDPSLDFNIALSYYKLGRYPQAEAAFDELWSVPGYLDIAEFHLGLIAAQQGQNDTALSHWRAAEAATQSPRLKALIQAARARLSGEAAPAPPPALSLFASGGIGYDSDPVLLSNSVELPSNQGSDWYGEAFGYLDYTLRSSARSSDELQASAYAHQYFSDTDFSQQDAQLSLRHNQFYGRWRFSLAGQAEATFLGGDSLQDLGGLTLEGAEKFTDASLLLRYDASRIAGGSGYTYLDGWRQRARLQYSHNLPRGELSGYYEFESNDRRDLSQDGIFFSESPIRHSLGLRLDQPVSQAVSLELRGRYRYSRYRDADQSTLSGAPFNQRRQERLAQAGLATRYRLSAAWDVLLQYEYSHNYSNAPGFDYNRHLLLLGVEWMN